MGKTRVTSTLFISFVISLSCFWSLRGNLTKSERIALAKLISREKFSKIRSAITKYCNANNSNLEVVKERHSNEDYLKQTLWHEKNYGMLWCCNYKVGSSTMIRHITRMGDYRQLQLIKSFQDQNIPQSQFRALLQKPFLIPSNETLENIASKTLTVVFVRHPFIRLVSGYFNKIVMEMEIHGEKMPYRFMRDSILEKYRTTKNLSYPLPYPTPAEFSQFILDESKEKGSHNLDIHFQPQSFTCPYCKIDFDVVIVANQMETNNIVFLSELLGFKDKIASHIDMNRTIKDEDAESRAIKFFAQLTNDMILQLFQLYKIDFDMFLFPPPTKYFQKTEDLL